MKINWGFGPPKDDAGRGSQKRSRRSADRDADGGSDRSEQHTWTAGASMATRAVVGLLWVALVAGPLALGLQLLVPDRAPVVRQGGDGDRIGEAAAVSEFAERAVVAWLETPAQESDLLREYFGDLDQARPEVPWTVQRPGVAEIVKDGSGLWSVVVGVDATEGRIEGEQAAPAATPAPGSSEPADEEADGGAAAAAAPVERITSGRLYFRVPVLYVAGQMVAQALPAPVPAPAGFDQVDAAYDHDLSADHPAFARVANFLTAMLVTGDQAELEAYSNPGTAFRALNPVPYASIELTSIVAAGGEEPNPTPSDGEQVEVQANVTLRGSNAAELGAQYALVLLARQGRWEVAELRTAPVLAEPVPLPTPVPTATPTPGGTTPAPTGTGTTSSSEQSEPSAPSTDTP